MWHNRRMEDYRTRDISRCGHGRGCVAALMAVICGVLLIVSGCGADYAPLHDGPSCEDATDLRCVPSEWASFTLEDVNPQSPTFGKSLEPSSFQAEVVVVALFAGW